MCTPSLMFAPGAMIAVGCMDVLAERDALPLQLRMDAPHGRACSTRRALPHLLVTHAATRRVALAATGERSVLAIMMCRAVPVGARVGKESETKCCCVESCNCGAAATRSV